MLRPGSDPGVQELVFRTIFYELQAAAMGQLQGWLEQQQAFFRDNEVEPASHSVPDYGFIIHRGIAAKKREPKAVLAAKGAVACPRVTAEPVQHRRDMAGELRWRRIVSGSRGRVDRL